MCVKEDTGEFFIDEVFMQWQTSVKEANCCFPGSCYNRLQHCQFKLRPREAMGFRCNRTNQGSLGKGLVRDCKSLRTFVQNLESMGHSHHLWRTSPIDEQPQKQVPGEDEWRCAKQDGTIYHLKTVLKADSSVIMFMEQKATVNQIFHQASLTLVHLRSCFHLET